jgi:hypothetical protein
MRTSVRILPCRELNRGQYGTDPFQIYFTDSVILWNKEELVKNPISPFFVFSNSCFFPGLDILQFGIVVLPFLFLLTTAGLFVILKTF